MRVTQSMLSSNMLRNLNNSYGKMSNYQDMLTSGRKFTKPSEDPVAAVMGMGYRVDLGKTEQYQRNLSTANSWLDSTDEALDQASSALKRVKELIVQAANDTNGTERQKINAEMKQIKEHLRDISNTQVAGNYIFSGTHVNEPLYTDKIGPQNPAVTTLGKEKTVEIDVFDGIRMSINTPGAELFGELDDFMAHVTTILDDDTKTSDEISEALGLQVIDGAGTTIPALDSVHEKTLKMQADVGARQNRVELMENRLGIGEGNIIKQMSLNEDTEYPATITNMVTQSSIHQAALSVGAKIIQQTLVDFIR
ncbi:flagellar hook-associated protein FlgL [Lysinibacillus sp. FSL H8-0500]|uniref:Flagellar hook protein FlgL n=1 Tax=Lysinibacillus macroides TaxID=33935 RepID=A0A0M9DJV8_9BACI|nr:flagellar hook-associated protein FlgL [Lysinibacillus macroides]KOY82359.1 flagellar hook protein FlgL [Lysinibacillus macroides]QPR66601.1 flagellar hook-associated protein FlgL [Lysinibacillus macroides]